MKFSDFTPEKISVYCMCMGNVFYSRIRTLASIVQRKRIYCVQYNQTLGSPLSSTTIDFMKGHNSCKKYIKSLYEIIINSLAIFSKYGFKATQRAVIAHLTEEKYQKTSIETNSMWKLVLKGS